MQMQAGEAFATVGRFERRTHFEAAGQHILCRDKSLHLVRLSVCVSCVCVCARVSRVRACCLLWLCARCVCRVFVRALVLVCVHAAGRHATKVWCLILYKT
jgi:hypothetical protein